MPLFQNSVVTKHLQTYDKEKVFNNIKIESTVKEIDKMVYELYGLTEKDIRIIEGG